MGLDGGDVGGGGAHISGIIDEITSSGEADSVSLFFLGPDVTHGLDVCGFASLWDLAEFYKENRVCSLILSPSLGKAA
eukprot:scaffold21347_cov54-Attheya_sp.AAC.1